MLKTGWIGILGVLVLVLLAFPAAATVSTASTSALQVTVNTPDEVKTNALNYITITFENKASYPVSARVVVKPSYFAIAPEWVQGVNAMKTGSGVTFTLFDIAPGEKKTVKIVIPGSVLEGLKGKVQLIGGVECYPFTSGMEYGIAPKNLNALSVSPAESFIVYESPLEAIFPVALVVLGIVLVVVAGRVR